MSGNALILAWLQQPFLAQLMWLGGVGVVVRCGGREWHDDASSSLAVRE